MLFTCITVPPNGTRPSYLQESDADKKKDKKKKKKKKKKHSKKHKKHKSRKRSQSVSKDNEPETKIRGSQLSADADGSENDEPPLWRDREDVRTVRINNAARDSEASSAEDSDDHSAENRGSSPENNGASPSPDRLSEERGSTEDSRDSSSSSEDEDLEKLDMDLEELEKKLRERALRSMQRRQEIKAAMPPARESLPVSSPSSEDSE